ncbi:hypothetical protein WJX84_001026 [Apatococcus fuscideae]|uniref:Uncharacterized protein n=1 Tax=Apatococcus fuscideae TaxID=2026836 RepID=A0AAW1SUT4_9CHLO
MAAAAGLVTVFQASAAFADAMSSPVVNTAQTIGSAGVVLTVASAAAYGGILLLQRAMEGFSGQPGSASYSSTHKHTRNGGNTPAFALGIPSGPATLPFQPADPKPASPLPRPHQGHNTSRFSQAPVELDVSTTSRPSAPPQNIAATEALPADADQQQKEDDLAAEFSAAAEASGVMLDESEKSATVESQQAEYNARLKVIRMEANRKAAEEARRQLLRQRALDNMQPEPQPVPAASPRTSRAFQGPLAGFASFFASLVAWLQAMWQQLSQAIIRRQQSRTARSAT